jgi:hypothetical protein
MPPMKKHAVANKLGQLRLAIPVIEWPDVQPPA